MGSLCSVCVRVGATVQSTHTAGSCCTGEPHLYIQIWYRKTRCLFILSGRRTQSEIHGRTLCKTYMRTNGRIAQGEEVSRRPLGWLMWPCASSSSDMETSAWSESGGVKPAGVKYCRAGNKRSVENMRPSAFEQFVSRMSWNTATRHNIPLKGELCSSGWWENLASADL